MSLIATLRRHQRPGARSVLTVFMLVWINIALQSCVMAATPMTLDAPAQAVAHDMEVHADSSHGQVDLQSNCSHCAVTGQVGCNDANDCGEPDALKPGASLKLKDAASQQLAELPLALPAWDAAQRAAVASVPSGTAPLPCGPALNMMYCVYRI